MKDVLNMFCAVIAKVTHESLVGPMVPLFFIWFLINETFAEIERVFWGETFHHVGDVILLVCMTAFYIYHLFFLATHNQRTNQQHSERHEWNKRSQEK